MKKEYAFPGFVDVHVHFRDPGVPEAEDTASGMAAARRGGFAAVVTMPNTEPAGDSVEWIRAQLAFDRPRIFPSACITKGRLGREVADLESLAAAGAAFFTDDGTYVSDAAVLEEAMRRASDLNMCVCQHALAPGICEADAIRRDLSVCRETGCRLHIQHISTAAGVELVRAARREGLPVTAEATPHHLLLTKDDIRGDGGNYKMAPPLATAEDRAEVRRGVKDGLLFFATDHAPHPAARKNCPYELAANGIVGLETAIPVTYRAMVEEEGMSIEDWARAWYELPRDIISVHALPDRFDALPETRVVVGETRAVDVNAFAGRSRNCPYHGMEFDCWPKGD